MRIAIGQLSHESNTMFGPPTTLDEFRRQGWHDGPDLIDVHRGVRDYLGGMIDAAEQHDIEIVPTFTAQATPSGTIDRAAFDFMASELLSGIREAGEVDAVCLALHGAGSALGVDDIEGWILREVRDLVGPDIPVMATLDLHCHSTELMVENATALLSVHEFPHIDSYERGFEAVELAMQTARGEVDPVMELVILPMNLPPQTSLHGPAREINERCWSWEERGLIDVVFVHGYPWTDVPIISSSVIAIANGNRELAREAALDVAGMVWNMRDRLLLDVPPPAEAIAAALRVEGGPVVIGEFSDNPGGGAPGDGTHSLNALLDANRPNTVFGYICDPETAEQAHAAGPGATINVRIGGRTDPDILGSPVEASAYVKSVTDGNFITQSPMGRGSLTDLGKMARLIVGNVDVIVGSDRRQTIDPELFLLHGIDVSRYQIVMLKSDNHFIAGFESVAAEIMRCDPSGWTPADLTTLNYERIRRPIWPLDDDAVWER